MDGARGLQARAGVEVQADAVGVERGLLQVVVAADVVDDRAGVALGLNLFAVALHDGGAVAVGARDKDYVLRPDAVAQEARGEVGGHKDAADVAEVQVFVAVGHAARDHGAAGKDGTVGAIGGAAGAIGGEVGGTGAGVRHACSLLADVNHDSIPQTAAHGARRVRVPTQPCIRN